MKQSAYSLRSAHLNTSKHLILQLATQKASQKHDAHQQAAGFLGQDWLIHGQPLEAGAAKAEEAQSVRCGREELNCCVMSKPNQTEGMQPVSSWRKGLGSKGTLRIPTADFVKRMLP